jgi:hypothetical protein
MAYPPEVPPHGRSNTDPMVNSHPSDHNLISYALTDILNELGADPSGDHNNVTDRLNQSDLDVNENAETAKDYTDTEVGKVDDALTAHKAAGSTDHDTEYSRLAHEHDLTGYAPANHFHIGAQLCTPTRIYDSRESKDKPDTTMANTTYDVDVPDTIGGVSLTQTDSFGTVKKARAIYMNAVVVSAKSNGHMQLAAKGGAFTEVSFINFDAHNYQATSEPIRNVNGEVYLWEYGGLYADTNIVGQHAVANMVICPLNQSNWDISYKLIAGGHTGKIVEGVVFDVLGVVF